MTFTYTLSPASDLTRVRYHLQDTDSAAAKFSDEEINFVLSEEEDWQHAVISLLKALILKMSVPDFKADWLQVSLTEARKSIQELLTEKRREFGLAAITATIKHRWRSDSRATEAPDFEDMQDTSASEVG